MLRPLRSAGPVLAVFLLAGLTACGTPESIKTLSSEQLKAQAAVRTAIDESFKRMEQVVALQLAAVEAKVTASKHDDLVGGAKRLLVQQSNLTPEKFAEIALGQFAARDEILVKARSRVAALKEAHANVLRAYDQTVEAQKALDDYLRLEQADEKIVNQLLLAVGVTRDDLKRWMDAGLSAFASASELLAGVS